MAGELRQHGIDMYYEGGKLLFLEPDTAPYAAAHAEYSEEELDRLREAFSHIAGAAHELEKELLASDTALERNNPSLHQHTLFAYSFLCSFGRTIIRFMGALGYETPECTCDPLGTDGFSMDPDTAQHLSVEAFAMTEHSDAPPVREDAQAEAEGEVGGCQDEDEDPEGESPPEFQEYSEEPFDLTGFEDVVPPAKPAEREEKPPKRIHFEPLASGKRLRWK